MREEKEIRFIDPEYTPLFTLPDGGYIRIDYPDGETLFRQCQYLDDTHMKIGTTIYHICEFAEGVQQRGGACVAAPELEVVAGYRITDKQIVGRKVIVLGHNPDAVQPYVTWHGSVTTKDYEWGHYFSDKQNAYSDFRRRIYEAQGERAAVPKANQRPDRSSR